MSSTYISDNVGKVHKPHSCRICDERIEKGEKCHIYKGVEDGEGFYTLWFHHECWNYSRDFDWWDWESIFPGDVSRKEVLAGVGEL